MRAQIYIPKDNMPEGSPSPEEALTSVGLGFMAKGMSTTTGTGPDGGQGSFFMRVDSKNVGLGYSPEAQTWLKSFRKGGAEPGLYWTGFYTDNPPKEADLRREDHRQGKWITLTDERFMITTPETLDRFPSVDTETGQLTWAVDQDFNWLVVELDRRRDSMTTTEDGNSLVIFDSEADFEFFTRLLQVNYAITPELLCELRLISQQAMKQIVAGLMGLTLLEPDGND